MRARLRPWLAGSLACVGLLAGLSLSCAGGSPTEPNPTPTRGSIRVSVQTTGSELDADGYLVSVIGRASQSVSSNGSTLFEDLSPGAYTVGLSGVAANCSVTGGTSRDVTVAAGPTTSVTFSVTCAALAGSLVVTTVTTGENLDPDGYSVVVDGSVTQSIGTAGSISFANLAAGTHAVQLDGLAANCAVSGPNPRNVTIAAGGSAQTTFTVECSSLLGSLTVTTTTTGPDPDPDGYAVSVDGGTSRAVAANGSVTINGLPAGSRSVELTGLAANCAVSGANPQAVTVPEGGSATAAFAVTCGALTGGVEVLVGTTGTDLDPDGYSVLLDGGSAKTASVVDTVTFANVTPGNHSVQVTGLANNCSVSGTNPRSVTVVAGSTVRTTFSITCTSTVGELRVGATTTGASLDPDGFVASVDGGARTTRIGVDGEAGFGNVAIGEHEVELLDVAANCQVFGDNPRTVTVLGGQTVTTTFSVECSATTGQIRVRSNTTGVDLDPDGYVAEIDGGLRTTRIGVNDETGFGNLASGDHQVELTDVASNCTVLGANPRTISLAAGETVLTTFGVECARANLIAFTSDRDGNYEIYVMNPDGSDPVNLTKHPGQDSLPAWSPDGTRIAWVTNRNGNNEVYFMDYPGGSPVNLTKSLSDDTSPAWSPDGQRIAFLSDRTGSRNVFVQNIDGTGLVNISSEAIYSYAMAWSPDGTRLAHASNDDGPGADRSVYVSSATGGGTLRITPAKEFMRMVAWSPDGSKITFDYEGDGAWMGIGYVTPDGLQSGRFGAGYSSVSRHAWSPDGTMVTFADEWTNDLYPDTAEEVWVTDSDGFNGRQLTDLVRPDQSTRVSWSPDGSYVAFTYSDDIYTTSTAGIDEFNVTNRSGLDDHPAWRP